MQGLMGIGAIVFFVVAVSFFNDPTSIRDSVTNEPVGVWEGRIIAGAFALGSIVFATFSWASRWLPIDLGGEQMVDDLPTGLAWQISSSGVKNTSWGDLTIPWEAISHIKKGDNQKSGQHLNFYFINKDAVGEFLGAAEASKWNVAVSFMLPIHGTNINITDAQKAIKNYCPRAL